MDALALVAAGEIGVIAAPVPPASEKTRMRLSSSIKAAVSAKFAEAGRVSTKAIVAPHDAPVDLLYRQIGQLKVENDFLSRKLSK
jgi:hypothetical protein